MSARLPSGIVVGALLRRVNDSGGLGMVLAKGDAQAGAILVLARENGANPRFLERGLDFDGAGRSAERRVGKECVSRCRSRWSPSHKKIKRNLEIQTNTS